MNDRTSSTSESERVTPRALIFRSFTEFFVIVVGVLVALGVEAWYSSLQDVTVAREYRQRLVTELASAREFLQATRWHTDHVRGVSEGLLATFEDERRPESGQAFLADLNNSSRRRVAVIFTATYEDLIATGNLGLFEDPELREALDQSYRALGRVDATTRYGWEYSRLVRAVVPIPVQLAIEEACPGMIVEEWGPCRPDLTAHDVGALVERLRARDELREEFRVHFRELTIFARDVETALERVAEAQEMLAAR